MAIDNEDVFHFLEYIQEHTKRGTRIMMTIVEPDDGETKTTWLIDSHAQEPVIKQVETLVRRAV